MIGVVQRYAIPDSPFFFRGRSGIEQIDLDMPHMLCLAHELANASGFSFRERPQTNLAALASAQYFELSDDMIADLSNALREHFDEELSYFTGQAG
jgi:hypothetical protein